MNADEHETLTTDALDQRSKRGATDRSRISQITPSEWERAYHAKRRVFYERATDTIRQCPENYLLAVRRDGRWRPQPDKASPINPHSLGLVLDEWQSSRTADALADAVELAFWGSVGRQS